MLKYIEAALIRSLYLGLGLWVGVIHADDWNWLGFAVYASVIFGFILVWQYLRAHPTWSDTPRKEIL